MLRHLGLCIFILLTWVFVACEKPPTEIVKKTYRCKDIPPPEGVSFGYKYVGRRFGYGRPCFNPNNPNEFVYTKTDSSKPNEINEIWTYNLETKENRHIADDALYYLKWGHNNWIVFNRIDNQVWKVKSNGDSLTQLTSEHWSLYPDWHPDGKKIIFQRVDESPRPNLMIMDDNGQVISELDSTLGWTAHWSPDGEKIIFGKDNRTLGYVNTCNLSQIHPVRVIPNIVNSISPYSIFWFPDSDKVAWADGLGSLRITNIYTHETVLVKLGCDSRTYLTPSVSSDGKKIIVERINRRKVEKYTIFVTFGIYIIDLPSLKETKVEF